jgi:hypothetical protein
VAHPDSAKRLTILTTPPDNESAAFGRRMEARWGRILHTTRCREGISVTDVGYGAVRVATDGCSQATTKGAQVMKLNPPRVVTWLLALVLGVVGIVIHVFAIPVLASVVGAVPFGLGFWLVVAAFVLLLVATVLKGL